MVSTAKGLTDIDIFGGSTNFVAPQKVVLALITSFPREAPLLVSLTKVGSVPPQRVSRSVAPSVLRRTLFMLYAENSLICFSCRLNTDIMLSGPSFSITAALLKFTVDFKGLLVPQFFDLTLREVFETCEKRP